MDIKVAVRVIPHYCFGCGGEMVLKQGEEREWHFAHKAGSVRCHSDNALHEAAKVIMLEAFRSAAEARKEYKVGYLCSGWEREPNNCPNLLLMNVADRGASIESERTVVAGTRSDLVVTKADGKTPRVVIEITVTHDLESATRKKYEASGIPLIKVKPSWAELNELQSRIVGYETLNISDKRLCGQCKMLSEQWAGFQRSRKEPQRGEDEDVQREQAVDALGEQRAEHQKSWARFPGCR